MTGENQTPSENDRLKNLEEERLRQRLVALERQADRLRFRERVFGLGIFVALVLAAISAFTPHLLAVGGEDVNLGTVTAERLVLEDANGLPRGSWSVDEEGNARLTIQDRQGRTRMSLSVLGNGSPGLSLANANGRNRVGLALLPDESTNLAFADGAGVPRTILGLSRADAAFLLFADANGEHRVSIGLDGTGEASIVLPESTSPDLTDEGGS
jgi:hypothetical protein